MQCYKKIPTQHKGTRYMVPCGKCNFCLQNDRIDWAIRMMEEEKVSKTGNFLTITYNDQNIPMVWEDDMPIDITLCKKELANFHQSIKRKQKRLLKKYYKDWKIRYFSVGEYGTKTGRPHYHSAMFNVHPEILHAVIQENEVWGKGRIYNGTITEGSAGYVAKYMIDRDQWDEKEKMPGWQKPFRVMSRNPGIGESYLESNRFWHRPGYSMNPEEWRMYMMQNGYKKRLPRYFKNKIFEVHEEEKEAMKTSFELLMMEMGKEFENKYLQEIERLGKIHPEPEEYYFERIRNQYNNIKKKSLQANRL